MTVNQAGIEANDIYQIKIEMVEISQQFLSDISIDQGLNLDVKQMEISAKKSKVLDSDLSSSEDDDILNSAKNNTFDTSYRNEKSF